MGASQRKISPFIAAIVSILTATTAIVVACLIFSRQKLSFKSSFFFVCHRLEENFVSASAISCAVNNLGGAGYILGYDGNYYVTVACYYKKYNAEAVCESLKKRNFDCFILEVKTNDYDLPFSARKNSSLYRGNLDALLSISKIVYECSNGLDDGSIDRSYAQSALFNVEKTLTGLIKSNPANCFSLELTRLRTLLLDTCNGIILSKDLRAFQIAVCDAIINIKLY